MNGEYTKGLASWQFPHPAFAVVFGSPQKAVGAWVGDGTEAPSMGRPDCPTAWNQHVAPEVGLCAIMSISSKSMLWEGRIAFWRHIATACIDLVDNDTTREFG